MRLGPSALTIAATLLATTASAGPDAIRLAVINDQTGPFSAHGGKGSAVAARLAVEDMGGQVLGKKIEILAADHQNKPEVASALTNQYIDVNKVDAFIDGASSAATLAMQGITRDRKRIFLITGGASSDLTGKDCSPTGFHLVPDTYSFARSVGVASVQNGGKNWYFITADYSFGISLENDARSVIGPLGAKVVGSARHPLNTPDFSSFLLQAQGLRPDVIAFANAGTDLVTALKQAQEFQVATGNTKLASFLLDVPDIQALGLQAAGGVRFALPFYWDMTDETRKWSERFRAASGGLLPTRIHAMTYAGVLHYLKAIKAAGTDDGPTVAKLMHATPMNDMLNKEVLVREDGRVMTDMYLLQAKKPDESKGPDDLLAIVSKVPASEVFRPLEQGGCPLDRR
ncbi:ABC transporter substrate-binding protein [Microvirga tunisiensis]|uniref:ABC transporter substrate-binding protein n=2 Tax=Microvirga tunisiensis TaxID=2108360 RepID=A0A5N7MGT0_9HYPH|nr:ABC transporter substrate-binding protein [Microvirga tunisiensis]MPR26215.1 ABC transporter substrate-binding protein [Microvirga tunisiensis]